MLGSCKTVATATWSNSRDATLCLWLSFRYQSIALHAHRQLVGVEIYFLPIAVEKPKTRMFFLTFASPARSSSRDQQPKSEAFGSATKNRCRRGSIANSRLASGNDAIKHFVSAQNTHFCLLIDTDFSLARLHGARKSQKKRNPSATSKQKTNWIGCGAVPSTHASWACDYIF